MSKEKYDFSGWATRCGVKCSDGRTIMPDAFKHMDGKRVPLVWMHGHGTPFDVVGHADLESRDGSVYAYGSINETEAGKTARELIKHGDICGLSIYANKLKQTGPNVVHGDIREVSLVLAGANPEAYIDQVMAHGEESEDCAVIYLGDYSGLELSHFEDEKEETAPDKKQETDPDDETVQDVIDTMNEKQQTVLYALLGMAREDNGAKDETDDPEGDNVKHNVFDADTDTENTLSHDAMHTIITDTKRFGSMKESFLAHANDYGITDIEYLFPEAKTLNAPYEYIKRETDWVPKVLGSVHRSAMARIKSVYANITEDEARAKGYIKGKLKKEEVFKLLKRSTEPKTVYKKQKIDRDDIIDIPDFDVISALKTEMRMMLDEEIARAILIGDGRSDIDEDKISEDHIRPVWKESDFYTIKAAITPAEGATEDDIARAFIRTSIKTRKHYKGSGNPVLFTTEDVITACLLLEDGFGHALYESVDKLKTKLRVSDIVSVPVMEGATRKVGDTTHTLLGLFVSLSDYNVGADKGGAVSMFQDFDIDYNQEKILIETRCSGAMVKPFGAYAVELVGDLSDYIDDDFDMGAAISSFASAA